MPCFGAMGPMWGPMYDTRRWARPCHHSGWGFHPPSRREWLEHLERYAQELRAELATVGADIQELAPEKKGP